MVIWKPLEKFKKQRKEWAWHTDFSLEHDESMYIVIAGKKHLLESCPEGKQLKIHLEICVEPFDTDS